MRYTISSIVASFVDVINLAVEVLSIIALLLFFVGMIRFIYRQSDPHGKQKDKEVMIWGLVALFVLTSIWGILRIMKESLLS
ncbi:hypothetical protein H7X87_04215 [Acetobacteraceae bacterium]|nr:hypothetical protein [Candidatus Parcubacteria bacterium]